MILAKVNALWELQSATGEELSALLPSMLMGSLIKNCGHSITVDIYNDTR